MTAVENKIPDLISLVKKTDYNTKFSETEKKVRDNNHDKYIATPEFDWMTLIKKLILIKQNLHSLKVN